MEQQEFVMKLIPKGIVFCEVNFTTAHKKLIQCLRNGGAYSQSPLTPCDASTLVEFFVYWIEGVLRYLRDTEGRCRID